MSVLIMSVSDSATPADWAEVHKALAAANGQVVRPERSSARESDSDQPTETRRTRRANRQVSQPTAGVPAKGSQEAKDRMAAVRAAKAAKASERQPSQPTSTRRTRRSASQPDFSQLFEVDLSDDAVAALDAMVDHLVVPERKDALQAFLDGRCPLGDLANITTRKGASNLAADAFKKVQRADRAET